MTPDEPARAPEKVGPPPRRRLVIEISVAYAISVVATVVFYQLGSVSSFFRDYLHTLVGAVFVAIPMIALLPRRESFDDYGLPPQPLLREILFALAIAAAVFPPFWLGFRIWWGWERELHLIFPSGFFNAAMANLVVVALPEELFYRGYLMGRLDHVLKKRLNVGAPVGWSLVITSVLFALGHWVVTFDPQRLAVFFPAMLFGWIRLRRGSITAAVVFHALCNIYMDALMLGYGVVRPQDYYQ